MEAYPGLHGMRPHGTTRVLVSGRQEGQKCKDVTMMQEFRIRALGAALLAMYMDAP